MAKGLPEARERLRLDSLNADEKRAYYRDMEAQRYQRSVIETGRIEGREEGRAEGRAEEIIAAGYEFGLSEKTILERLQKKLAITPQQAQEYLATYTKETEQRC